MASQVAIALVSDKDLRKDSCRRTRLLALAATAGPYPVHVLTPHPELVPPGYGLVPTAFPPLPASVATFADVTMRSGVSKGAFVSWLASSSYEYAWHLEDDALFYGRWDELVHAHAHQRADVVAKLQNISERNSWGHICKLADGTMCTDHAWTPPGTHQVPLAGPRVMWPALRLSRKLAQRVLTALAAGATGHHEVLTGAVCVQHEWCTIGRAERTSGLFLAGEERAMQYVSHRMTLEDLRGRLNRSITPPDLFHPVKCEADHLHFGKRAAEKRRGAGYWQLGIAAASSSGPYVLPDATRLHHSITGGGGGGEGLRAGISGPVDAVLSASDVEECAHRWKYAKARWRDTLVEQPYIKSAFAHVEACRRLAMTTALVSHAKQLLGDDDMILASMSLLVKEPGFQHRWHSDIENVLPGCNRSGWAAWVSIANASHDSGLDFVTQTADLGIAQELLDVGEEEEVGQCKVCPEPKGFQSGQGLSIEERGRLLEGLARRTGSPGAQYVRVPSRDGQAWFFRGATWHASINRSPRSRLAVQFHYQPARCRFRRHDMESNQVDLLPVLPAVVPVLGRASQAAQAVASTGPELFPTNNWLLPLESPPRAVHASFDHTAPRLRQAHRHNLTRGAVFSFEDGFVDTPCAQKAGVDAGEGLVDMTKCKRPMLMGNSHHLRIMEYHASALRRDTAAHELRIHEELELLYVVRGHALVTLGQKGGARMFYRRRLDEGALAFYPAWQPHGLVAVDAPQSVYIAIRFLAGSEAAEPAPSSVRFWHALHERGLASAVVVGSPQLEMTISTHHRPANATTGLNAPPLAPSAEADILLIVTSGVVEFKGTRVASPGTIFLPAASTSKVTLANAARVLAVSFRSKKPSPSSADASAVVAVATAAAAVVPTMPTTRASLPTMTKNNALAEASGVHVCAVSMGRLSAVDELELMLRSLRATSRSTLHVHVLTSPETSAAVASLLEATRDMWGAATGVYTANAEDVASRVAATFPGASASAHHSGPWGFAKNWLHEFFHDVDRCVFFDTDMLLGHDVAALWAHFEGKQWAVTTTPPPLMQLPLGRNQHQHRGAVGAEEMCTCVVLHDFAAQRADQQWNLLMAAAWASENANRSLARVSNQGTVFLAAKRSAASFLHLEPSWNLQGCAQFAQTAFSGAQFDCGGASAGGGTLLWPRVGPKQVFFGAMHANCMGTDGKSTSYEASSNASVFAAAGAAAGSALWQHRGEQARQWRCFSKYVRLLSEMTWAAVRANVTARCALRGELRAIPEALSELRCAG